MRSIKKILSVVLALCIALSVMSVGIIANAAVSSDFMKIAYVDAGRKFYTKDWFVAFVNEAAYAGFTHVCIGVGNDGMRFLLDDMTVVSDGVTYSSEDIKAGINAGNKAYYDAGAQNELTQAEMDEIILAADKAGVSIIPLINTPGHMDSILDCMKSVGIDGDYNGSGRTVDVTNSAATNFTKAFLAKYIEYFADKGCAWFDLGIDEYANDVYSGGSMGFGQLQSAGQYDDFVTYVNDLVAMVKAAGMRAMGFNDGVYFNSVTSSGTFDPDLAICYWSSGWGSYPVSSASALADKGHDMINTNGDYYYILGVNDAYTEGTSSVHTPDGYANAANFNNTTFMGGTVNNPIGSRFCIWGDVPGAETEQEVAANVRLVMRAIALRMNDESIDGMDTSVAPGGFNEDGTINVVTVTDAATDVSVSSTEIAGVTVTELAPAPLSGVEDIVSYDITPVNENGVKYTGSADVSIPVPASWNSSRIRAYVRNYDGSIVRGIKGTIKGGKLTFTVPHFSEIGAYALADGQEDVTVTVGSTTTVTIDGAHIGTDGATGATANGNASYSIEHVTTEIPGETTYTLGEGSAAPASGEYVITSGNNTLAHSGTTLTAGSVNDLTDIDNMLWNVTKSGDTYTISTNVSGRTRYLAYSSGLTLSTSEFEWTNDNGVLSYQSSGFWSATRYLRYNNGWTTTTSSGSASAVSFHTVTSNTIDAGTVKSTNITFTGNVIGDDTVTFVTDSAETVTFNVSVVAIDLTGITQRVEYWVTNKKLYPTGAEYKTDADCVYTELSAANPGVYSEEGVLFNDIIAEWATESATDSKKYIFRMVTLLAEGEHQEDNGPDQTLSGIALDRIRYWNDKWSVFNGAEWIDVSETDQLVAYYLQYFEVTPEIHAGIVDWSPIYSEWQAGQDAWFWDGYVENGSKFIFTDYAVVYEDGTQNPDSFPVANTMFGHFDGHSASNPRVLGKNVFYENENFEIWKLTITEGTATAYSSASRFTPVYDETTETTVWEESMGGEPAIESLTYTANRTGKLIKIYVRAKVTEASLTVHYIDNATGEEFYSYNIGVKEGTLFDSAFGLNTRYTSINDRLVGNTVINIKDVEQAVTANLATMPEISIEYRYSEYNVSKAELSDDSKQAYIYYNFLNTHSYVADFGLPLIITQADMNITEMNWSNLEIATAPQYGTFDVDAANKSFTYTPNKVFKGVDTITFNIVEGENAVSHTIYIYPATSVYYEQGFMDYTGSWAGDTSFKGNTTQATEALNKKINKYGFDPAYGEGRVTASAAISAAKTDYATFSFRGTGVDIYADCTTTSGVMSITVKNSAGAVVKVIQVNTKTGEGTTDATAGQAVDSKSLLVASVEGLAYGDIYTVTIRSTASFGNWHPISIAGFRVYGTLTRYDQYYTQDAESGADFVELRDYILATSGVTVNNCGDMYNTVIANNIYNSIYKSNTSGAVLVSSNAYNAENIQDLLDNGPKNELFLRNGQALTFTLAEGVSAQIGFKAPMGSATITVNDEEMTISAANDMFYLELSGEVVITNISDNILSITDLKAFDNDGSDLTAIFAQVSPVAVKAAVASLDYTAPEEPDESAVYDVNGDGKVNVSDMVGAKKYIAGAYDTADASDSSAAAGTLSGMRRYILTNN